MDDNTFSMRREAERRASHPQEEPNRNHQNSGPRFMLPGQRTQRAMPAQQEHAQDAGRMQNKKASNKNSASFLSNLFQDNDQLIILALIIVLMRDEGDNVLLLALAYLLL